MIKNNHVSFHINDSNFLYYVTDEEKKHKLEVLYAVHKKRAKAFFNFLHAPELQPDGSELIDDTFVLSFDCEKNLQLLKVPDSAAYYSRNVYLYNFTIVNGYSTSELDKEKITAYCWTENQFTKNANLISSCVIDYLNRSDLTHYKHIRLVCDGCAAQNKNSIIVTALLHWLKTSAPSHISDVQMIFPVTGHSYIPPDRVFGQIEKKVRKRDTILSPDDYLEIIREFATIKIVGIDLPVYNIKRAMADVLKPCASWPFSISKIKRLQIFRQQSPNNVLKYYIKGEVFYHHDLTEPFSSFCKRGKTLDNLTLIEVPMENRIDEKKKADIPKLLVKHFGSERQANPSLSFFAHILGNSNELLQNEDLEADVDEPDEPCSQQMEQPEYMI